MSAFSFNIRSYKAIRSLLEFHYLVDRVEGRIIIYCCIHHIRGARMVAPIP